VLHTQRLQEEVRTETVTLGNQVILQSEQS
jgi:hypothetical protein